ncbi:MAG: hypothetical protein RLZZ566_1571 [Pseudomonadota bacterium]|jgi:urea transport system ATP-binding protein
MTPDLMSQGAERLEKHKFKQVQTSASGDRDASFSRIHQPGVLDLTHGRILYLEDVNVNSSNSPLPERWQASLNCWY